MRSFLFSCACFLLLLCLSCQSIQFSKNPEALVPKINKVHGKIPFALILGSGGSRGLAHVGALEALEKAGLRPDLIIGCSAGSIVGALYASRPDAKWLKKIFLAQKAVDFFDFDLGDMFFSLSTNLHLKDFLNKNLPVANFEDLKIPFISIATNLQTGRLTPFFTGPVIPTLLASSAVPGVFKPVEIYDTYFVDGAVADPVPVQIAQLLHADFIVAVDIGQHLPGYAPSNFLDVMWRSLSINYLAMSKQNIKQADVSIEVPLANVGTFADSQNYEFYLLGRIATQEKIDEIKKALSAKAKNKKEQN
jgi:NTE family protein